MQHPGPVPPVTAARAVLRGWLESYKRYRVSGGQDEDAEDDAQRLAGVLNREAVMEAFMLAKRTVQQRKGQQNRDQAGAAGQTKRQPLDHRVDDLQVILKRKWVKVEQGRVRGDSTTCRPIYDLLKKLGRAIEVDYKAAVDGVSGGRRSCGLFRVYSSPAMARA